MPTIKPAFWEQVLLEMITLRRAIHRRPDLSGREEATVARLIDYLTPFEPQKVHTDLGGWGRFGGRAALEKFTELRWISAQLAPRQYPF